MAKQVFLGGSCGPTDWRHAIARPMLDAADVSWHDPQRAPGTWTADREAEELRARDEADVLLFVIEGTTRAVTSVAEAAYLIGAGRPLALAVMDVPKGAILDGRTVEAAERDDLNRGRSLVRALAAAHGVPIAGDVPAAVERAIALARGAATKRG